MKLSKRDHIPSNSPLLIPWYPFFSFLSPLHHSSDFALYPHQNRPADNHVSSHLAATSSFSIQNQRKISNEIKIKSSTNLGLQSISIKFVALLSLFRVSRFCINNLHQASVSKILNQEGRSIYRHTRMHQNGEEINFLITWICALYLARIGQMEDMLKQLSDINREEQEQVDQTQASGDGLDDIDVQQPLNSPSYTPSREESSMQRKRKRRNSWDSLMNSPKESAEIISAEIRGAAKTSDRVFGTESNGEELRNRLFSG
ncbi:hypothetical protein OROGR_012121 [Orobanche gracilis]